MWRLLRRTWGERDSPGTRYDRLAGGGDSIAPALAKLLTDVIQSDPSSPRTGAPVHRRSTTGSPR
jgi:hypothetical protein